MNAKALVAAGALVAFWGCSADYANQNSSPVLFKIVSINSGSPMHSDVFVTDGTEADFVDVALAVRAKNPKVETPQVPMAVFIERYEINYYRSDGRGLEGVDVPYSVSGNLTTVVDVSDTGNEVVSVEAVRLQAKLEPPLLNLRGGGQATVLSCMARITLHGHTTADEAVTSTGYLQLDFADYAD